MRMVVVALLRGSEANFYIHDDQTWQCFCSLLRIRPDAVAASAKTATSLPLVAGGLGLRGALRLREAAHWASWAISLKWCGHAILTSKRPSCKRWTRATRRLACKPSTKVVRAWCRMGWQAKAAREVESFFLANLRLTLSGAEGAMLRPQGGPHLRSSASRRIAPLVWNRNFSGSCSFVACDPLSLFQPVPADAVLSTSLAIIGRPVLLLGRW